jgi:uncharacterized protein with ParB-like and HNH nuclease domain
MKPGTEAQIYADTISIGDLLNAASRLTIPTYQRPFDWKKDEASDLLDDLRNAIEEKQNVFFGTIVLDTSNSENLQIIDGQQRITTFNLLLIALRTILNKNGTTEDIRLASKIHSVLTYDNRTSGKSLAEVSRLEPSNSIKDAYINLIDNQEWDGKNYRNGALKAGGKRIKPILDFFFDELSTCKHDDISRLLNSLYESYVVVLRITNNVQALEIFESANVRGMELNAADLLKSFFIAKIDDQKDADLENRWMEIVSNTDNVIRMIKHFGWTIFNKKIVANRNAFYSELKNYGKMHSEKALLDSFDNFAQAYGIVESGDIDDLIKWAEKTEIAKEQKALTFVRSLQAIRLFRVTQTYPLIAIALVNFKKHPSNNAANALVKLADTLEKYHFVNSCICQRRGNEVEGLYADASRKIAASEDDLENQVNEIKNKLKNQLASFAEFKSKFIEISYDTSASTLKLVYFLFDRIDNVGRKGREIESIYNPRLAIVKGDWEVEHILAKNPETPHSVENTEDVINNIGNLLVVPSGTNKSVGNRPVNEKVRIYQERIGKMPSVMAFCGSIEKKEYGDFSSKEDVGDRAEALAHQVYEKVFVLSKEQSSS